MAEWIRATARQGVTAGARYELVYSGEWLGAKAADPETARFVVGGRPDVVATDAFVDWRGAVHVRTIFNRSGQLGTIVPMVMELPASDDVDEVGPLAVLNLLGAQVEAELEWIRLLGPAGDDLDDARQEEQQFREELGEGELRDLVANTQEKLKLGGIAAGTVVAILLVGEIVSALVD